MPEPFTAISAYGIAGNFDGEVVGFLAVTATGAGLAADTMEFVSDVVAHEVDVADAPDYVRITAVGSVDTVGDNQVLGPAPAVTPTLNLLGAPSVGGFWLYDPTTGVDATMAVLGFLPQTAAAGLAAHTVNAPDGWVRWRKQPIELEQRVTSLEDRTVPDAADGDPDQVWTTDGAAGSWQDAATGGLTGAYEVPIVAGVFDLAAAVALGYSTVQTTVVAETDIEIVLPDPETTPDFTWYHTDPTGVCTTTFTGGALEHLFVPVNLYDGSPGVRFMLRMTAVDVGGVKWTAIPQFGEDQLPTGKGDVAGPASATDNSLALFDGTTGKLLKDGGALGDAAAKNTGTTAGTVAAGDDSRITGAITISDLDSTAFPGVSVDDPAGPNYWSNILATAASTAPSSEMYLFPITHYGMTLARLAMRVSTLEAGSEARLGIWDISGISRGNITAGTGTLLEDVGAVANLSGAATGIVRVTPTIGLLPHGSRYAVSVSFSSHTSVRWRRMQTGVFSPLGFATAYNEGYFGWKATGVSHMSGLPSTLPAMTMYPDTGAGARTPYVGLEFT